MDARDRAEHNRIESMPTRSDAHVRAFVALELPAEAKARLAQAQARLQARLPGVRWVSAAGLHLTLRFLGDSTPRQIERLTAALHAAACACPAGAGRLAGLGVFPERGAPRVLWVGLELPAPLFELQAACERAARAAGFAPETRAFTPHLTLGRWRERAPRPTLEPLDLGGVALDTVVLYRSELRPSGAVYTALTTSCLAPGAPA